MKIKMIITFSLAMLLMACQQKTLQQYIVKNSENPDFKYFNFQPNDFFKKSQQIENKGVEFVKNANVLLHTKKDSLQFKTEQNQIKAILSDKKYQNLVHINQKEIKIQVDYLGKDDAIEEIIIFGVINHKNLFLIRALTNKLSIEHLTELLSVFLQNIENQQNNIFEYLN